MANAKPSSIDFQILLALAGGKRHGYAIMQQIGRQTDGAVRVGPGSLYGAIKRLLDAGWIAEDDLPAGKDSRRTCSYRLTASGRRAASESAREMAALVSVAASHGLVSLSFPVAPGEVKHA